MNATRMLGKEEGKGNVCSGANFLHLCNFSRDCHPRVELDSAYIPEDATSRSATPWGMNGSHHRHKQQDITPSQSHTHAEDMPGMNSTTGSGKREWESEESETWGSGNNTVIINCSALRPAWLVKNSCKPSQLHLWLVRDPCGLVCVVITWLLMVFAEWVLMVVVLPQFTSPYYAMNVVVYNVCAILALASHARVMLTDPGAMERGSGSQDNIRKLGLPEGEVFYRCPKCVSIKPLRAHHCSVCQRCIRKMDHHCPWVNNCIGEDNQKYFVLFNVYTFGLCVHAFVIAFSHFLYCTISPQSAWTSSGYTPMTTMLCVVLLLLESIVFALFTASMLWSQACAVWADTTGIEQLKKEKVQWQKAGRWASIRAVFGDAFSWRWLSPFSAPQSANSHAHLHTV